MEWNESVWIGFACGLALGAVLVFLLVRRSGGAERERSEQLASELAETREELDSHREEVARHFQQTSELFAEMTDQYSRLYVHLAHGAKEFCTDEVPKLTEAFDPALLASEGEAAKESEAAEESTAAPDLGAEPEAEPEAEAPEKPRTNGGAPAQI